jgi:single-strand DNA-binding protein
MIIGNLGRDPEMRYTPSGQAVTQFTVATNRRWRDQQGEWQEETEWFRVVVWREQAERAAEQLRKGHKVYVEAASRPVNGRTRRATSVLHDELIADRFTSGAPRARGRPAPARREPSGRARLGFELSPWLQRPPAAPRTSMTCRSDLATRLTTTEGTD